MSLLPFIGGIVLIFVVGCLIVQILSKKTDNLNHKSLLLLLCTGLILLFSTRLTEFSLLGMLHAKLNQADVYLGEIRKIEWQANLTKIQLLSIQKSLEEKSKLYDIEIGNLSEITAINTLQSSAMSDSRIAFEELQAMARHKSNGSVMALYAVASIKHQLEGLRHPDYYLGVYQFQVHGEKMADVSGHSLKETLQYIDSNVPIEQVHAAMSGIEKKIENMSEKEMASVFYNFLKESQRLSASVVICAILAEKYNQALDIFDFNGWIDFLSKK